MSPKGFCAIIAFMKTRILKFNGENPDTTIIREAAAILREGGLVAFPTETVYGLGGDGLRAEASAKIYAAKGRPSDNPLILHIADQEQLTGLVRSVPEGARRLMEAFWPGPLTLIFEKSDAVPYETTGGLDTVAVRMPSHKGARALIRAAGVPVAAPSANLSGQPSPTGGEHVIRDLEGRVEMILDGGDVPLGLESTIVDVTGDTPVILRPGYVTLEQIRTLLGAGEMDPAILEKPSEEMRPKAPGMKYRHYAPQAEMVIVEGDQAEVIRQIEELAGGKVREGKRVGILCAQESRGNYHAAPCKTVGTRAEEASIARNLYRCLREFDEEQTEFIYSEAFSEGTLGTAIMNRLVKAAGYRIIRTGGQSGKIQ